MNVLFLTMARITSLQDRGVYTDLMSRFAADGHSVFVVSPLERRNRKKTYISRESRGIILHVQTFNLQKTNIIEKGIGTLAIEYQFLFGIKKHLPNIKFDLVMYSTPPITFAKVISYIKNRDSAYSYLLLKDIFPQNAVDMKLLKKDSFLHRFFLSKERNLYKISDAIGCMSEANRKYLLAHHSNISPHKIEVNPNTILPYEVHQNRAEWEDIRNKLNLPFECKIFVYGGNLGIPQGIDFLIETIESTTRSDVFFLIIGTGTEFPRIKKYFEHKSPTNAMLMQGLPKDEYEFVLRACDVGMLFLHRDFTIPNFPSRLLSYLELKLPVLAATDLHTDVGTALENAGCGYSVLWGDQAAMQKSIDLMCNDNDTYSKMKENAWRLLITQFHVDISYHLINKRLQDV